MAAPDQEIGTVVRQLRILNDRMYEEAAYLFVLEALDYSMFSAGKNLAQGEARHLSCQELLEGIRRYALEEMGPLAKMTFKSWGVRSTDDFGAIVFQMCSVGLLHRREEDQLEHFHEVFDFEEVFAES